MCVTVRDMFFFLSFFLLFLPVIVSSLYLSSFNCNGRFVSLANHWSGLERLQMPYKSLMLHAFVIEGMVLAWRSGR